MGFQDSEHSDAEHSGLPLGAQAWQEDVPQSLNVILLLQFPFFDCSFL